MNLRPLWLCALTLTCALLAASGLPPLPYLGAPAPASVAPRHPMPDLARLPLQFEVNQGQSEAEARFLARASGYNLLLAPGEAILALAPSISGAVPVVVRLRFVGAAAEPELVGVDKLPGEVNYYLGQDQTQWRTAIPTYAQVMYRNLYPGIDLLFYGNQQQLEHDFLVAPGRDPGLISVQVEGADALALTEQGELLLATDAGQFRLRKPFIYQELEGVRRQINGGYALQGKQQFGFVLADYNSDLPLVIDPVLEYSTYFGGNGSDYAYDATTDAAGNLYITGATNSTDFPLMNPIQNFGGGGIKCPDDAAPYRLCYDAFVTKLNPEGTAVLYSTYIGWPGDDEGYGIAVDAAGNAYMAGYISVNGEPPLEDLFIYEYVLIVKLDPTGASVWDAFWGPSDSYAHAVTVDDAGNVYVTGQTTNDAFPVSPNAVQASRLELIDGFVSVVDPSGQNLLYSTFLGGSGDYCGACYSKGNAIAVDGEGMIYVTGQAAPSFPTTSNAFQREFDGFWMAFVAKIDPTRAGAAGLRYATYLGGKLNEFGEGIALDAAGMVYVTGSTNSDDFPTTAGAYDRTCGSDGSCNTTSNIVCDWTPPGMPAICHADAKSDVFVAKLDLSQSGSASLLYSTYVGGAGKEEGKAIGLDGTGNAYVTGYTVSPDFPLVNATQTAIGGKSDAFVFKLSGDGSALGFSTFLGGSGDDYGQGIVAAANERAYVAGYTDSANFPTADPLRPRAAEVEAFIARLDTHGSAPLPEPEERWHVYLPMATR
jgi:hypothetical protein